MLQNVYLLAKIGADTTENERHFPKTCQTIEHPPRPRGPLRHVRRAAKRFT